jgi:hypothetical protein
MITKDNIRDSVHFLLRERAEASLRHHLPDVYYGWVPPAVEADTGKEIPGYWLGAADEEHAKARLSHAEAMLSQAEYDYRNNQLSDAQFEVVEAMVKAAEQNLREVELYRAKVVEGRREQLINRRVAKMFLREYRKASVLDWDLYNPAIPDNLRRYVQRQLSRPLGPTSRVYLYLLVQETIAHGEDFQTEAITAHDYLADNPLVQGNLDIDVDEDDPYNQRRAYVRELQAKAIRDRVPPAHENYDTRDILADFQYDGLPEQLGAMWIDKNEDNSCDRCKQGLRVRMIHASTGFQWAKVCPNYAESIQCHNEPMSPILSTRRELRDWAVVEWATANVA